jgi:hypothetical protein
MNKKFEANHGFCGSAIGAFLSIFVAVLGGSSISGISAAVALPLENPSMENAVPESDGPGLMTLSCTDNPRLRSERSNDLGSGIGEPSVSPGCKRATLRYASPDIESFSSPAAPSTVRAHCGFDGWNKRDNLRNFAEDGAFGNRNFSFEIDLKPESDKKVDIKGVPSQVFSAEVPLVGDEKALHCAFCIDGCSSPGNGGSKWDNNNRRDFGWGFRFPFSGPWMTLGNNSDGTTYESVQFENDIESPACLRYWPTTNPALTKQLCSGESRRIHRFRLKNLTPNQKYSYQFTTDSLDLDGLGVVSPRTSKTYEFVSMPEREPEKGWKIVVFSDLQDNGDDIDSEFLFRALASSSQDPNSAPYSARDAHFAIIPGDLAYNDEPGLWWTLFEKMSPATPFLKLLPSIGNHDTPGVGSSPMNASFRGYFDLPYASNDAAYYSFTHDKLKIFAMDSERPEEFQPPAGTQYLWMKENLAKRRSEVARRRDSRNSQSWTFSHWHIPCVNAGKRHGGRSPEFRAISGLLHGAVDWHISGHEHYYQRSLPLILRDAAGLPSQAQSYGLAPDQGTGYLVLPPGGGFPGAELSAANESPYRAMLAFPALGETPKPEGGFLIIRLNGPIFELQSYGIGVPRSRSTPYLRDTVSYSK